MTLFTKDLIPDDCQTVEQLTVWCLQILQFNYPDQLFTAALNVNGEPQKIRKIEANSYYYTATVPPTWAYAGRAIISLNPTSQIDKRVYKYAQSFGDLPIPDQLKRVAV